MRKNLFDMELQPVGLDDLYLGSNHITSNNNVFSVGWAAGP